MSESNYTEAQLKQISDEIIRETDTKRDWSNHTFLGKYVHEDWDAEEFVKELYEDYLRAVQQSQPNKHTGVPYTTQTTFESYLGDCLSTLKWRREELARELAMAIIDNRVYQNAKAVADMSEEAIRKYLEKSPTGRLIGV